jgi:hypothetical protein
MIDNTNIVPDTRIGEQYIKIGLTTQLTADYSISVWINSARPREDVCPVISRWGEGGANKAAFQLAVTNGGSPTTQFRPYYQEYNSTAKYPVWTYTSKKDVSLNAWHNIVVVRKGISIFIWCDGIRADSTSNISGAQASNYDVYIGREPGTSLNHWTGKVDDIRIFNRALSIIEINALYTEKDPITQVKQIPKTKIIKTRLCRNYDISGRLIKSPVTSRLPPRLLIRG